MVSFGVSALGRTDLHSVAAGVKINGQHYRDVLLTQNMMNDIRHYSDCFTHFSGMEHQLTAREIR